MPHFRTVRALILTVLAPFKNRERTYTDSTCPISEPWAHLSWQCLPHFKTVSAVILTVRAPFQKRERTYSDSACPILMMMKWCLMSLDVSWHIRDKLWPMPKHSQYFFTSTETRRLVRTDSPGRPPRLSHSSWTMLPHFRTVRSFILTVLAPFQNRERTYPDSACPISKPWAHLYWQYLPHFKPWAHLYRQCLPHFRTVSAFMSTEREFCKRNDRDKRKINHSEKRKMK